MEQLDADGVGGVRDFVATGTLPNGQAVELMANGTVRAVAGRCSYGRKYTVLVLVIILALISS